MSILPFLREGVGGGDLPGVGVPSTKFSYSPVFQPFPPILAVCANVKSGSRWAE